MFLHEMAYTCDKIFFNRQVQFLCNTGQNNLSDIWKAPKQFVANKNEQNVGANALNFVLAAWANKYTI